MEQSATLTGWILEDTNSTSAAESLGRVLLGAPIPSRLEAAFNPKREIEFLTVVTVCIIGCSDIIAESNHPITLGGVVSKSKKKSWIKPTVKELSSFEDAQAYYRSKVNPEEIEALDRMIEQSRQAWDMREAEQEERRKRPCAQRTR